MTIALTLSFYVFQAYGGAESGFPKSLVIGLRYFAPLLPLLAFAMAESVPRSVDAVSRHVGHVEGWLSAATGLWLAGVLASSFVVHVALDRWAGSQLQIRSALERFVPTEAVLVANDAALQNFIDDLPRPYRTLDRGSLGPESVDELARRHDTYFVALLDRSDSDFWRRESADDAAFAAQLPESARLLVDLQPTRTDRLRIWQITTRPEALDEAEASDRP